MRYRYDCSGIPLPCYTYPAGCSLRCHEAFLRSHPEKQSSSHGYRGVPQPPDSFQYPSVRSQYGSERPPYAVQPELPGTPPALRAAAEPVRRHHREP